MAVLDWLVELQEGLPNNEWGQERNSFWVQESYFVISPSLKQKTGRIPFKALVFFFFFIDILILLSFFFS